MPQVAEGVELPSTALWAMRCASFLLLLLTWHATFAQDPYVQEDTLEDPLRWSVGTELIRPAYDLLTNSPDEHYLRFEGFVQHWLRPDIALRASCSIELTHEEGPDPEYLTDSAEITRYTLSETRTHRLSAGVVIQKRREVFVEHSKHFAPLLGLMLVAGRESRSLQNEDQAYYVDSTGVTNVAVPGTNVVHKRSDELLFAGLEVSPGVSMAMGTRWELELRLPIEVTWWSVLDSGTVNYPDVPSWWDAPVNFGVRLPRCYVHYRW